jgi:putative GTP pyrophosphokinase
MMEKELRTLFPQEEWKNMARKSQIYSAAVNSVKMKLEVWNQEFRLESRHNPIHHIESRIKSPESTAEKLRRQGQPVRMDLLEEYVMDLAGVRVVCCYIDDVYQIAELLKISDLESFRIRDYIREPKPNGYRSYHMILRVPVDLFSSRPVVPVEVQLRTIAMDTWASLEHEILYKTDGHERETKSAYLKECAEELAHIDLRMQQLFQSQNQESGL